MRARKASIRALGGYLCLAFAIALAACSRTNTGNSVPSSAGDATPTASGTFTGANAFVVPVDLEALIRQASGNPNQFAVNVPHAVTTESAGRWSANGGSQVWVYAVQIRGAVSLSFHAPRMQLPDSAMLTVRSAATTANYRGSDAGRGDFWSRVQPGDTLEFTLEVSAVERPKVEFEITSFQAGFRGLSPQVPDHPLIARVRAQAAGDPDTPCVQNYACNITPNNSPPAQATVALIVGNQYQCTGTLINNTAQDNTPYILTARHCQNGKYGGGDPSAASSVTVYWDALSSCGTPLGSVYYTPNSARQSGATTVVEQQDAWLIKLDASPVVDDAQYAGFDAADAVVSGGYSIHHALGYNKQFTRWFGTALTYSSSNVLGSSFVSDLMDTVNDLGATGPGSSGAALFTPADRLAGVLSLGKAHSSVSGYGSCPAASPVAPSASNWESSFVSFAAIWNSTADSTSSTGSRTLRSVLDPASTGALSVDSMQAARLSLTATPYFARWNDTVTITWNAPNATQCTATGGGGSDGWPGTLPANGSRNVSQSSGGDATYLIKCDLAGGGSVSGSTVIQWMPPNSNPRLAVNRATRWTTRPMELAWTSVVGPCSVSGGDLSQDNLPASGSVTTTSATPADITYTLVCGPAGFRQSTTAVISYVTPNLAFVANGTRRKLGQRLHLAWLSYADSCIPTGGAADDQWAATARSSEGYFDIPVTKAVGTFTYTLSCSSGPITLQKAIQVTVADEAAFATLTAESASVTLSNTPSDYIHLRYQTNLDHCYWSEGGGLAYQSVQQDLPLQLSFIYAEADYVIDPSTAGVFNPGFTCVGAPLAPAETVTARTSVTVLPPPPPIATMSASASQVAAGTPFTITWSSTGTTFCTSPSDSAPGNIAFQLFPMGVNGSRQLLPPANFQGDAVFSISCPGIDSAMPPATASVTVTIGSPGVTLLGSTLTPAKGTSFSLTWNEPNASSCSASGGGANGSSWTGALAIHGSVTQTASVAGVFTYALTCIVNGASRQSSVSITVADPAPTPAPTADPTPTPTPPSSGSSGGGGGAMHWWEVAALLVLAESVRRKRRGELRRVHAGMSAWSCIEEP